MKTVALLCDSLGAPTGIGHVNIREEKSFWLINYLAKLPITNNEVE